MSYEMTDSDRTQAYSQLSDQLYKRYNDRRDLEWRIHVAIWTFLAAIGYLLVTQHIHPGKMLLLVLLIIPIHAVWCMKIHIGEFRDGHRSEGYLRAAERILAGNPERLICDEPAPIPPPRIRKVLESWWWWIVVEAGTTALITIAVILLAKS